jgi:hypothetical protein
MFGPFETSWSFIPGQYFNPEVGYARGSYKNHQFTKI